MENVTKRFLSLLVAVVMVLSMIPTTAFATTENTDETTTKNTVVEETGVAEVNGTKYETLQAAINAADGGTVTVLTNITLDTAITVPDGTVIDLNNKTLYINVENSYYNDVTVKDGSIVLGKDDVHVCDGYFLVNAGKTLVLNGVDVSSSAEGIKGYAVFHLKTGANLDLIDCMLDIAENEYSAGYVVYAGESTATVDITGTTLTAKSNGIVHATTVIEDSQLTIEAVEHGINRSGVTIDDSAVTISGGTGRGITAQHGDLVITGNSTVSISNMGEATIELRGDKNLTVDDTAQVTVDVAVNNTTSGTVTGEVTIPKVGNNGNAHTGTLTIWGQANVNASESMKLELYCGDTLVGTTVLVQKTTILDGSARDVTWNFYLTEEAEDGDGYWDTTWEAGHPNVNAMPDKVVLYLDGEKVDEDGVLLSGPDDLNKVYTAISAGGVITGFATTLQAAVDAADGKTVTLLRDVILTDTLNIAAGTTVTLELNGKTVSQTKAQTTGYSMIQNDGDLTIQSSVDGGKISYTDSGNGGEYVSNTITNRGTLTLKSGTVENLSASTVASNGYPYAIDTSIWGAAEEVNTVIEGGKVYCESYSSLRLRADSETEPVNVTISGGEVYGRIEVQNPTSNKASKGTLTITGGQICKNNSSMAVMFFDGGGSGENMKASITGGTIDGAVGYSSYFGPVDNFDENVISGGTFTTDVSDFCAEGFEAVYNETTGTYGVEEAVLSGSGTEADPFLINDLDDLLLFRDTVNTYSSDGSNQFKGQYVKLTSDIDLAGINWTPIGTNSVGDHMAFLGTFDGDGHTISNLYINADGGHLGFFARVGSYGEGFAPTVKNLKFHNVDVSANVTDHWTANHGDYVGGVIANAGGNSVVSNITVTGDVYIVGCGYVGGIVGHGYPDLDNCHVTAIDGSYLNCGYWCAGGIIGYAGEGGTPITNCSVSGLDIWTAYGAGAAIAGLLQDGNKVENVTVSNVDITSSSDYCMGYVAGNGESSTMTGITVENVTATANGNTISATDAAASVDGAIYFDLQAAVDAADGKIVMLLRDVVLTDTLNVAAGTTVTLELSGKTVSQTKACAESYAMIQNKGDLTINDTVGDGKISFTDTGAGDPSASWGVYTIHNAGALTVNDGTIENLSAQNQAGQAFAHTALAIFQYSGSTTINGGVISTPNYRSVRLWSGEMTINGGQFGGQVWVQCVNDTAKLTINGGGFSPNWNDGSSVFVNNNYNNKAYVAEFTVTGGSFATKIGANDPTTLAGELICGGTFTESAMSSTNSALIAEGYVFEQNADGSYGVEKAPVAQVGDVKYKTIDEAIANWTAGTTLTLLADVTLSDVIQLKSTEHHILNLSTYTMTAASGKNAIVIQACGTGGAERNALTINADTTNPGGIDAGKKSVVYYKYADGGITAEDRPIIKINGGVFTGSTSSWGTAGIYTIGTAARKCATVNIAGGTFNCSVVGSTKSKLIISGGTFNYTVSSQGDSTCSRLISGGKFKTIGFMTADSNNTKFWIGTSMGNSNVGVYVDDEGYIVVGGPVVTEAGTKFEASASYSGASSYLQYSSAKDNSLYYTSVEEAFADNNKASGEVTVYVDELDMTGISYKGTIIVPEGETLTITYAEDTTPAWKTAASAEGMTTVYTEDVVDGVVTRVYRTISPMAQIGEVYFETLAEAVENANDGDTIVLLNDVALTESLVVDKTVTLDLNGHALSSDVSTVVVDAGDLTVQDAAGNGKIISTDVTGTYEAVAVKNRGKLTLSSGNVISGCYGIYAYSSVGNIVVNGGTVTISGENMDGMAIAVGAGSLTITGGTITANGVYWPMYTWNGLISISGGIFDFQPNADYVAYGYGAVETTVDGKTCYKVEQIDPVAYIGTTPYYTVAAAIEAAQAGDTVVVNTCTVNGDLTVNKDITVEAADGAVVTVNGQLRITADGVTVKGLRFETAGTACYVNAKDVLIENCELTGSNGLYQSYTSGTVTFKNSKITGTTYGIHFDGSTGGKIVIDSCEVTGWTSFASTITDVTITGTEFKDGNYNVLRFYQNAELTDCTFTAGMRIDSGSDGLGKEGVEIALTGCQMADGSALESAFPESVIVASDIYVDTVKLIREAQIGDNYYKTLAEAMAVVQAGETVTLLENVKLSEVLVLDKAITLDGNGKTLTSTADRAINVSCDGEVIIKDLAIATTANTERAINVIQKPAALTLENVTAEGFKYTLNVASSGAGSNITVEGGKLSGYAAVNIAGSDVTLTVNDAELIGVNDVPAHESNAFGVIAFNYGLEGISVTVNGGTLTATSTNGNRQFIVTAADSKGAVTITGATLSTVAGDVFNGVVENVDTSFDAAYAELLTAQGFVVSEPVNGMVTIEAAAEASYNGVNYAELSTALNAAYSAGGTVKLLNDCKLEDMIASVPAGVTLDLNGNTLEANNIWAFGQIVDGTVGGEGGIVVAGNAILDENNSFLPLYDTAFGGYRFYAYGLRGRGVKASGSGNSLLFKYGFAVDFDNADAYLLMKDTANSGLKLKVDLTWTDMPSGKAVIYTVSDATVVDFAENAYEDIVAEGKDKTTYVVAVSVTGLAGLAAGTEITATMNIHTAVKVISAGASCTGTIEGE